MTEWYDALDQHGWSDKPRLYASWKANHYRHPNRRHGAIDDFPKGIPQRVLDPNFFNALSPELKLNVRVDHNPERVEANAAEQADTIERAHIVAGIPIDPALINA